MTGRPSAPTRRIGRVPRGAGARGTVELVGAELLELTRSGTPLERIGVVCESPDRWRATFESVLGTLGIPYAFEHPSRLGETALGRGFVALLRYAWLGGGRGEPSRSFALRFPASSVARWTSSKDACGDARSWILPASRRRPRSFAEPTSLPLSSCVRARPDLGGALAAPDDGAKRVGLEAPPVGDDARGDARAYRAAVRTLAELEEYAQLDARDIANEDLIAALERTVVRPVAAAETGRVAVLDYSRARTRTFDVVFLLGLEEGPSSSRPAVAALGRRPAARSRRPPRTAERRRAGPLSLLHGVYAANSAARSRPRSRQRRRRSA